MLLLLFNSCLVFGLADIFKFNYEFTSRVASMFHAIASLVMGVLFITHNISNSQFQFIINYNIIFISTDIYLYITNKISNKDRIEMLIHHSCFLICSHLAYIDTYCYALGIMS